MSSSDTYREPISQEKPSRCQESTCVLLRKTVLSSGGAKADDHTTRHPGHVKPGRRRKYRRVRFKAPTFSEDSREDMDRIVVGW